MKCPAQEGGGAVQSLEGRPSISVLLVSFNQAPYVAIAIQSILNQCTPFPVEIVVADDASTDGTQEVVGKFAKCFPDRFVVLPPQPNMGVTANYRRGFANCKGDYIAVIEGDDYWTSRSRLEKMVSFLERVQSVTMAANRFLAVAPDQTYHWHPSPQGEDIGEAILCDVRSLIRNNFIGNFSTCVYRRAAVLAIPQAIWNLPAYDWGFNIAVATKGPIAYFREPMSVYRILGHSTWQGLSEKER
jgi:glycosyltransferase involved in cell wall biosynthesis